MSERSIIKYEKGKLRRTGKILQPDGTIRKVPEEGIKNIKPVKKKMMGGKVKKMQDGKSVKTGSDFLSQAKEKISGLVKPTGKKIPKRNFAEDLTKVIGMTPAGFIRKKAASLISKVPGVKEGIKKITKKSRSLINSRSGSGGNRSRVPDVIKGTRNNKTNVPALRKPTQIKKRSTSIVPKPKVSALPKRRPLAVGRSVPTTMISTMANPGLGNEIKSKTKIPKVLPKPRPPKVEKPKTPKVEKKTLPKVVKKKRSNIVGSSSYDAQFTYDKLKEKGGKKFAKNRMSKENFAKVKKLSSGNLVGGQKKLDVNNDGKISGQDFKMLRSSKGMRGGGKVIKMRGGGAATRGMNFNRGY